MSKKKIKSGVYEIVNNINGYRYIGSSLTIYRRLRRHVVYLNNQKHENSHLQRAWNKYGEKSFDFRILLFCDPGDCLMFEQRAMDYYKPEYNISPTAGSCKGCKRSIQTRLDMSRARKGRLFSKSHRLALSNAQIGRKYSKATLERMSAVIQEKWLDEAYRNSIMSHRWSEENRKRQSELSRGELSKSSKLTEKDVYEIRRLHKLGVRQVDLAKMYMVARSTITAICGYVTWKHLDENKSEAVAMAMEGEK